MSNVKITAKDGGLGLGIGTLSTGQFCWMATEDKEQLCVVLDDESSMNMNVLVFFGDGGTAIIPMAKSRLAIPVSVEIVVPKRMNHD